MRGIPWDVASRRLWSVGLLTILAALYVIKFRPTKLSPSSTAAKSTACCACLFLPGYFYNNGNGENVTTHQQFHPKRFFEDGEMSSHLPALHSIIDDGTNSERTQLKPRFLSLQHHSGDCQAVYYHIHKNGGTTMRKTMTKSNLRTQIYYRREEVRLGRERFYEESREFMADIYQRQQQENDVPFVFTFLRDPVTRFVSGLSQIFVNPRQIDIGTCPEQSNTTQQLFTCVLDMMENTNNFLNPHIAPQSFELYRNVMDYDIAVTVLDLSSALNAMLVHLGVTKTETRQATGRETQRFKFNRDQLTPELIDRICRVYEMDVEMLRHTGVVKDSACLS